MNLLGQLYIVARRCRLAENTISVYAVEAAKADAMGWKGLSGAVTIDPHLEQHTQRKRRASIRNRAEAGD